MESNYPDFVIPDLIRDRAFLHGAAFAARSGIPDQVRDDGKVVICGTIAIKLGWRKPTFIEAKECTRLEND